MSAQTDAEIFSVVKRMRLIARFMDNGWGIPFTRIRFGADVLSGFFPVVGDVIVVSVSLYLVVKAWELGAPRELLTKMLINVAIEAGFGSLPYIGGIFDVIFQANVKNVELLSEYLRGRGYAV